MIELKSPKVIKSIAKARICDFLFLILDNSLNVRYQLLDSDGQAFETKEIKIAGDDYAKLVQAATSGLPLIEELLTVLYEKVNAEFELESTVLNVTLAISAVAKVAVVEEPIEELKEEPIEELKTPEESLIGEGEPIGG